MWTFITLLAPAHALRNGSLFTGIVLRLSGNAASFAWLLSAALIPGILLDRLAGQYYRVITALALLALAVMAWEIICPLRHLAAFVNRCLTVDYFTTLRWTP